MKQVGGNPNPTSGFLGSDQWVTPGRRLITWGCNYILVYHLRQFFLHRVLEGQWNLPGRVESEELCNLLQMYVHLLSLENSVACAEVVVSLNGSLGSVEGGESEGSGDALLGEARGKETCCFGGWASLSCVLACPHTSVSPDIGWGNLAEFNARPLQALYDSNGIGVP